jgi:hypothetical protein
VFEKVCFSNNTPNKLIKFWNFGIIRRAFEEKYCDSKPFSCKDREFVLSELPEITLTFIPTNEEHDRTKSYKGVRASFKP